MILGVLNPEKIWH